MSTRREAVQPTGTKRVVSRGVPSPGQCPGTEDLLFAELELECGHRVHGYWDDAFRRCSYCDAAAWQPSLEDRAIERDARWLSLSLELAVPMHVQSLIDEGLTAEQVVQVAREMGQKLACAGDVIMFRSGKARPAGWYDEEKTLPRAAQLGTAEAFNALARGIAAASFQRDESGGLGIKFLGQVWVSDPAWLSSTGMSPGTSAPESNE